jgi:hypothetical protein
MATVYESTSDFDSKSQDRIEEMLHSGEKFIGAIPCWDFHFSKRSATKLVLTDKRLIAYKRGFIREKEDDVILDQLTSVGFKKGILFGKLKLRASGFSFKKYVSRSSGKPFASEIRNQTR